MALKSPDSPVLNPHPNIPGKMPSLFCPHTFLADKEIYRSHGFSDSFPSFPLLNGMIDMTKPPLLFEILPM